MNYLPKYYVQLINRIAKTRTYSFNSFEKADAFAKRNIKKLNGFFDNHNNRDLTANYITINRNIVFK